MKNKWSRGYIEPKWDSDFKNLPFVRQPIMQSEIDEWATKGYYYVKSFSGTM